MMKQFPKWQDMDDPQRIEYLAVWCEFLATGMSRQSSAIQNLRARLQAAEERLAEKV